MRERKYRLWLPQKQKIVYSDNSENILLFIADIMPLDEDEVLEDWTGLQDKNSTPIYEGDLIRYNQHVTEVRYYPEMMAFGLLFHKDNTWLHVWNCEERILRLEVIGNIHEHPHLLK